MTKHPVCIFCDNQLAQNTKPEHILLNALGGRKTTKRVICSGHNNMFGSTIDSTLSKQIEVLRNLLQFESGSRKPPPSLRGQQAGSERVNIRNDGRPELVKPPFTVTKSPDGTFEVEAYSQTEEDFVKKLPHLAAKLSISEEQLIEQMKKGHAAFIEMSLEQMHHKLSFGGAEALRSVAKSCLVLLANVVGNEKIKDIPFSGVRNYVLNGDEQFNRTHIQIDSRDVPCLAKLQQQFGPFFNLIYVRGNTAGRVIGHFTLYNMISWRVALAETGGPRDVRAVLASNPLDPATWCDSPADLPDISFEWIDASERPYELERTQQRLKAMMEHHVQSARDAEISRIINDVFTKYGFTDDDQPIADPKMQKVVTDEILQRLAAHALDVPHERPFTPEELEAILRGKK